LNAGNSQRPKADDSGTKKRCGVQVIQPVVERMRELGASNDGRRVSTIDVVPSEDRIVAKILAPHAAEPARSIRSPEPRDADARSHFELDTGRNRAHDADDLVSRDDRRMPRR
jgi:hypothetical protein